LGLQLERQSELQQQLYTEFDRQYFASQNQATKVISNEDTEVAVAQASDFLVNQMKLLQDETEDLNTDNQELRRNYEELCAEVRKLEDQKKYYESCFHPENYNDENVYKAVMTMKTRIEELYDLGEDLKNYSTKQEAAQLTQLIAFTAERLKRMKENTNARLTNKIESIMKTGQDMEKEEHTVGFFAKLLNEKDRKIEALTAALEKEMKESKETQAEIESLRGKLDGLDTMCYGKVSLPRYKGCSAEDQ